MEILLQWLQDTINHSGAVDNLTTGLQEYNATVWAYAQAVAENVVKPISLAVLALFLMLEFANLYKKSHDNRKFSNQGCYFCDENRQQENDTCPNLFKKS